MTLYHYKDPIRNFSVKLELRRLSPLFSLQDEQREETQTVSEPEFENWEFKWQEKVFSQFEEELYSDFRNCVTNLTQNYHLKIVQMREIGARPNGRLFSYTDIDNFNDVTQLNPPILTDNNLNMRVPITLKTRDKCDTNNPIVNLPSKTAEISTKTVMYIMADLRRKDSHYPDEKVICTITLLEQGVLIVQPDFSEKWTRIDNFIGDTWEYKLTHISQVPSRKDIEKEENILNEIFERQHLALSNAIGREKFFKPEIEADEAIFNIFGEISCCYGFAKSSMYVKYNLALPGVFQLLGSENEECYTNLSSKPFTISSFFSPKEICIGHLFEYQFKGPVDFYERPTLNKPVLLLEVNSLDRWGRHSNLGYGALRINLAPGIYSEKVPTWRLAPRTKWEELSEYFLGVTPFLGNLDRVRIPFDFSDNYISKLGWKTESSGNVEIKLQIIRQNFSLKKERRKEIQTTESVMESSARTIAEFQALRRNINLSYDVNDS